MAGRVTLIALFGESSYCEMNHCYGLSVSLPYFWALKKVLYHSAVLSWSIIVDWKMQNQDEEKSQARSLSHSRNAHLCIVTARCCSRQAQQRFAAQPRTGSEGKCRRAMRTTCPCVYTQTSGIPNACFRTTSRQTKRTNYWDLTAIFMIMFFQAYHPGNPCDTGTALLRPCLGLLPSFDGQ